MGLDLTVLDLTVGWPLALWGLIAAPLLVLASAELDYVGGYYAVPAAVSPRDEAIARAVAPHEPVEPLPIYGCAVSPALQDQVDPLGLVY